MEFPTPKSLRASPWKGGEGGGGMGGGEGGGVGGGDGPHGCNKDIARSLLHTPLLLQPWWDAYGVRVKSQPAIWRVYAKQETFLKIWDSFLDKK